MSEVFTDVMARYKQARKYLKTFMDLTLDYEIINQDKVPRNGPAIVIANHRSDTDPLIVGLAINRYIAWLGASYDFKIPIFGKLLTELGMIPISADKKDQINAYREVSRSIKAGRLVGIFPEGDSYILGNDFSLRLGEFNRGFAHYALRLKANILPVTVIGIKEKVEQWPVPKFLREFLGMPKEVVHVKNRLAYKKVKVVIGNIIEIAPYLEMKKDDAIEKLIVDSKKEMNNEILEYGELERRKIAARQSGTRVRPEELSGQEN